jgi:hypothetical protein
MFTSTSIERRRYTCSVCGDERVVEVKPIEKWVAVCIHDQTRGGPIPVMQLREEGVLVKD